MYRYPDPDPRIEEIAADILAKIAPYCAKAKRVRVPQREQIFSHTLEAFKFLNPSSQVIYGYHGTHERNINSIIDRGLLGPGDEDYKMGNGNSYGQGVYATTRLAFASRYSSGCLLVLALLPGEQKTANKGLLPNGELDCDSINAGVSGILVFRGSCQVLPLFMIETNPRLGRVERTFNLADLEIANYPTQDACEVATMLQEVHPDVDLSIIIALVTKEYNNQSAPDRDTCYAAVDKYLGEFSY